MIKDLKELQFLLKLCRKQGVSAIELGGCKITFGDLPQRRSDAHQDDEEVPSDELTPEQLMFFSAGGGMPPGA